MAVNEERQMTGDFKEGITDGWVKKIAPNRGGKQNDFSEAAAVMSNLHHDLYDQAFSMSTDLANRITAY